MMRKLMMLVCVAGSLAACSAPPNDDDLRAAFRGQMESVTGKQGADMFKEELAKIKLIGCAKADAGGFKCDWQGPFGAASGRLVKSDGKWVLIAGGG